jgi:hypothetical protein
LGVGRSVVGVATFCGEKNIISYERVTTSERCVEETGKVYTRVEKVTTKLEHKARTKRDGAILKCRNITDYDRSGEQESAKENARAQECKRAREL